MNNIPTIVLTMGDPAGVGAEVVVKALADPAIAPLANWIVCGDARVLGLAEQCTGTQLHAATVRDIRALESFDDFAFGKLSAQCGVAAVNMCASRRRCASPEKPARW